MKWDQIQRQWPQVSLHAQTQWAKLTEDDMKDVAGHKHQLIEKLVERYGLPKVEAEHQVDEWVAKYSPTPADYHPARDVKRPKQP